MKCPLLKITTTRHPVKDYFDNGGQKLMVATEEPGECIGGECIFWTGSSYLCAIPEIAVNLRNMRVK